MLRNGRTRFSMTFAARPSPFSRNQSGATLPQIVSITGHTILSATRILECYRAMTPALAKAAMTAFANASATVFANQSKTSAVCT